MRTLRRIAGPISRPKGVWDQIEADMAAKAKG